MDNGKLMRFILGASIIGVSAFMFAFAVVQSAQAQTTWDAMPLGGGWEYYSSSNGTTGYSMPMGDGWRYYSFEEPTTDDKGWNDWSRPQYQTQPQSERGGYDYERIRNRW